jgi:hypothetical protein
MSFPPPPYAYQLAVLRAQGHEDRAAKLLDSLNRVQCAFGGKAFNMPDAPSAPMEGLVSCPAYVPLVEVERISDERIAA